MQDLGGWLHRHRWVKVILKTRYDKWMLQWVLSSTVHLGCSIGELSSSCGSQVCIAKRSRHCKLWKYVPIYKTQTSLNDILINLSKSALQTLNATKLPLLCHLVVLSLQRVELRGAPDGFLQIISWYFNTLHHMMTYSQFEPLVLIDYGGGGLWPLC